MHFIIYKVREFHHVYFSDSDSLMKFLACNTIVKFRLSVFGDPGFCKFFEDFFHSCSVEYRSLVMNAQFVSRVSEQRLIYLPEVHSRRNA